MKRALAKRTCVGCRAVRPQTELLRLVADGRAHLQVDLQRRRAGRGAYVCARQTCLQQALRRGRLAQSLRRQVVALTPAALLAKVEQALAGELPKKLAQALSDGRARPAGQADETEVLQGSGRGMIVIEAGLKRQVTALSEKLTLLREEPPAGAGGLQK